MVHTQLHNTYRGGKIPSVPRAGLLDAGELPCIPRCLCIPPCLPGLCRVLSPP